MAKASTATDAAAKKKSKSADKPAKSSGKAPAKSKGAQSQPNIFQRLTNYFRDVRTEMRRVVWPTREDVFNSSIVVIVTLLFFIVFTFAVDQVVIQVLSLINRIGG